MNELSDLLPLYLDNDHSRIRCVGGPSDGKTLTWSTGEPPFRVTFPVDPGPPTLASLTEPLRPLATADYRPRLDNVGKPSRDDDGTLVYEYVSQ